MARRSPPLHTFLDVGQRPSFAVRQHPSHFLPTSRHLEAPSRTKIGGRRLLTNTPKPNYPERHRCCHRRLDRTLSFAAPSLPSSSSLSSLLSHSLPLLLLCSEIIYSISEAALTHYLPRCGLTGSSDPANRSCSALCCFATGRPTDQPACRYHPHQYCPSSPIQ
jgi:hypothetical protein